ncbi:threonine ammonia-lyase [Oceanispirochaeta sp. M1]|uniref:threonine ammonia-lyase n=1 Tax=Oceanispirochaeta sp. M1 TaxID=2283433 RepID=UPI000E097BEA|nr:threonine ammonia-lyase [Oceanispirochaeta sp. M1]NPD72642.1 threonine ammonia-lyase [Oceanispirochaeta sp. M1]RDG31792.1 threonine ammonia-lyase [Oceanispirochaeta sp. M1]
MKLEIERIEKAAEVLKGITRETKLIYSPVFSTESGNEIYLKPENLQLTGAFKIRGAYFKISCLTGEEKKRGLIASSAGNHAQGVALAAQMQGVRSTIVMPKTTPLIKVEATKNFGARVILEGDCYDDAYQEARRLEKKEDLVFIHPFDDYDVMAGQGTIGLEILDDLEDVHSIIVPIGGGGLISGIAAAVKARRPDVRIIGVEPDGARAMTDSIFKNKIQTLHKVDTIADGVAVKTPGSRPFSVIKDLVDEIITVSDAELMESFLLLLERHKLIAENSGVLSLAALHKLKVRGEKIVPVISGGNIDVVTISSMIDRGLVKRGRIFCFSAEMPDEPGQLLKISEILADENANIIKLDHNQFKTLDRFKQVLLEVTVETNGHEHVRKIIKALEKGGYSIERVY